MSYLDLRLHSVSKKIAILSNWRMLFGLVIFFFWIIPVFEEKYVTLLYPLSFILLAVFSVLIYQQVKLKNFLKYLQLRFTLDQRKLFYKNKPSVINSLDFQFQDSVSSQNPIWEDLDLHKKNNLMAFLDCTKNRRAIQFLTKLIDSDRVSDRIIEERQEKVSFLFSQKGSRKKWLTLLTLYSDDSSSNYQLSLLNKKLVEPSYLFGILVVVYGIQWILYFQSFYFSSKPFYILGMIVILLVSYIASLKIRVTESYPWVNSFESQVKRLRLIAKDLERLAKSAGKKNISLLSHFQSHEGRQQFFRVIRELDLVTGALGVRQNYIIYGIIHAFFPWDFYWTLRLDKLKGEIKQNYFLWLDQIAELEALLQVAELSSYFDHGVWPKVIPQGKTLVLNEIQHPFMRNHCIPNSLVLTEQSNKLLLITGSNMSGKSTFLRTVAMNHLLMQMGAKVVASFFQSSAFKLVTSLKRTDSLEESFSTFYSEVKTLKRILDDCFEGPTLFLIDEIFRGTNNRERLMGSQRYIEKLIKTQGLGIITTHDLELASMADVNSQIFNEHFVDRIEDGKMVFDYLKKPGPCPSTNALKVMEMEGLY
ncbi:MAG: hypothetical protein HUU56_17555 [Bdellovibrionaceae bacterium]|nr:hypothetical protein [Pseudobdellovibrionaceae bacterium]